MILEILGIKNFGELCEGEGIFQEAPLGVALGKWIRNQPDIYYYIFLAFIKAQNVRCSAFYVLTTEQGPLKCGITMRPITDLHGVRRGANPYLPTGQGRVKSVSWCQLTDENGTPLRNDAGEEYRPVLCLELEGRGWFRVPRTTPRYTETLAPVNNTGAVLDIIRRALEATTYEEVVASLTQQLVGRVVVVTRTPMRMMRTDLTPYVGQVVVVDFAPAPQGQQTTVAPAAAAQQRKGIVALSSDRVTIPFIFQNVPIRK